MKHLSTSLFTNIFALAALLLVLPFTSNLIVHSKLYLLFIAALVGTVIFIANSIRTKKMEFVLSPILLPLSLFGVFAFISSQFTRQYPMENYLDFGGAFIAMVLIAIIGSNLFSKKQAPSFITVLSVGAAVVVIDSLLQLVGYGSSQLFGWMLNVPVEPGTQFTLVGSSRAAFQVVALALTGVVAGAFVEKKVQPIRLASLLFLIIGLGLYGWVLVTNQAGAGSNPSFSASWSIALDSLKTPQNALIGIGPSNYKNAYNAFRPVWLNNTDQWTIPFTQGANAPLTIMTTMGFTGLISWLWLVILSFLQLRRSSASSRPVLLILLGTFVFQLLTTFNYPILLLQALLLGLYISSEHDRFNSVQIGHIKASIFKSHGSHYAYESMVPLYLISATLGVGVLFFGWHTAKSYMAFTSMFSSYKAAQANNVVRSYELNQRAIALNPYLDTFHREYASTNMALAIALSNKTDITEQEQQQVGQLLQQAVREARNATTLDPNDTENLVILAQIYQDMIAVTEEAQQWSIDAYTRAIETNPTNPFLRILLGNVFAQLEEHQTAINLYNQAIELKPDIPEAYYRIAQSLIAVEQFQQAETALRATLSLLDESTEEYKAVQQQLEQVSEQAAAAAPADGETVPPAAGGQDEAAAATPSPTPTPEETPIEEAAANDIPAANLEEVDATQQSEEPASEQPVEDQPPAAETTP